MIFRIIKKVLFLKIYNFLRIYFALEFLKKNEILYFVWFIFSLLMQNNDEDRKLEKRLEVIQGSDGSGIHRKLRLGPGLKKDNPRSVIGFFF